MTFAHLAFVALFAPRALVVGDDETITKAAADSLRSAGVLDVVETRVERRSSAPIGIDEAEKLAFRSRAEVVVIALGTGIPSAREYEIDFDVVDVKQRRRLTRGTIDARPTIGDAADALASEVAGALEGKRAVAPIPPTPPKAPIPPVPPLDPAGALFPAELVMRHQRELGLDAKQRQAILGEIRDSQSAILEMQWKVHEATGALNEVLEREQVDEKDALARAEEVMRLEGEVKRAHLSLLIRIKNRLTPEQQKKLHDLR